MYLIVYWYMYAICKEGSAPNYGEVLKIILLTVYDQKNLEIHGLRVPALKQERRCALLSRLQGAYFIVQ